MGTIKQLRWWAYKILPLVYDDSLSYYEVISKVTQKLNEVVDTTNKLPDAISEEIENQLSGEEGSDVFDNLFSGLINAIATKEADEVTYTPNEKQGGELVWLGDTLYEVTSPMASGTNYIVGTNIVPVDISDELKEIKGYISTHNEYFHERASEAHNAQTYLYWKDNLYRADKDINVNDILGTDGQLTAVNTMDEITSHYHEMHEADNNLQTQIDGNDGDIEKLQAEDVNLQTQITSNNSALTSRIDNIVAQAGADNTEIVDARMGASDLGGIVYANLGTAIRTQINNSTFRGTEQVTDINFNPDTVKLNKVYTIDIDNPTNLPLKGRSILLTFTNDDNEGVEILVGALNSNEIYIRSGWGGPNISWGNWIHLSKYTDLLFNGITNDSLNLNELRINSVTILLNPNCTNLPVNNLGSVITLGGSNEVDGSVQFFKPITSTNLYVRQGWSGAWGNWFELTSSFGITKQIDDNDEFDANNCLTNQCYVIGSTKAKNLPSPYLGTLISFNNNNSYTPGAVQIFITYLGDIYYRNSWGNSWFEWNELVKEKEQNCTPIYGLKNFSTLGDSWTQSLSYPTMTGIVVTSWATMLSEKIHSSSSIYAIGGLTTESAQTMSWYNDFITNKDENQFAIIFLGTNDANNNTETGNATNYGTNDVTFIGKYSYIVKNALEHYKFVFCLSIPVSAQGSSLAQNEYNPALKSMCESTGYEKAFYVEMNERNKLFEPFQFNGHLSSVGYGALMNAIFLAINKTMTNENYFNHEIDL